MKAFAGLLFPVLFKHEGCQLSLHLCPRRESELRLEFIRARSRPCPPLTDCVPGRFSSSPCEQFGHVERVSVPLDPLTARNDGYGLVTFTAAESAARLADVCYTQALMLGGAPRPVRGGSERWRAEHSGPGPPLRVSPQGPAPLPLSVQWLACSWAGWRSVCAPGDVALQMLCGQPWGARWAVEAPKQAMLMALIKHLST